MMSADKSNFLKAIQTKAKNTNDWNMYQDTLGMYKEQNATNKASNELLQKIYGNNNPTSAPQSYSFDYTKPLPWLTNATNKASNELLQKIYGNNNPTSAPQSYSFDYTKPLPWLTNDKLRSYIIR